MFRRFKYDIKINKKFISVVININRLKLFFKAVMYSAQMTFSAGKFLIVIFLLLNLVSRTLPLFNVYVLKCILDAVSSDALESSYLLQLITFFVFSLLLEKIVSSLYSILSELITEKTTTKYLTEFLEKMKKLPLSVVDTSTGRNIIDEARYCGSDISDFLYRVINILSGLYTFVLAFFTLVTFNIWVSMLFILLSIPGIIVDCVYERKNTALKRKTAPDVRRFNYYRWMLTDAWPSKDVRMYDLAAPIKKRYEEEKNEYRHANKTLDRKKLNASLVTEIVKRSGEILFTLFVILRAVRREITVGDIALYIGMVDNALSSFQDLSETLSWSLTRFIDNLEPVFKFKEISCPEDRTAIRLLDSFESLVFENVYFKYPLADRYVLSGVSFTLHRGDRLSIVGINGAGKSTIIKLMLGLYEIDSGKILINGYPMSDYNIKDVRKLFSALFQNYITYPLTLRENIALSDIRRAQNDEEIIAALKQSGVYNELQPKLEKGLDAYITRQFDDDGIELSGGQRQKVALSRAYFKNAPIIIFDEPSSALDAEAEDRIFNEFKSISRGKTGIMISHRISSACMASKIIVLEDGKIIEEGRHEELIAQGGLYWKMYTLQKEKYTAKESSNENGH